MAITKKSLTERTKARRVKKLARRKYIARKLKQKSDKDKRGK